MLVGCGSYTHRDYVTQADAICASTLRQVRALGPAGGIETAIAREAPLVGREVAALVRLRRPGESARAASLRRRFLSTFRDAGRLFSAVATAAARHDRGEALRAAAQLGSLPVAPSAAAYGLRVCGQSAGTVVTIVR